MTPRLTPSERLALVVLAFTTWTFVLLAAIGSPLAASDEPGGLGDFRIVYDLIWLTSVPAFALLADVAYGKEGRWLRVARTVLIVATALGAVLIPTLALALLVR